MIAVLAILIVGVSSLQLTPEAPGICGKEMKAFEAIRFNNVCTVFCAPIGECGTQLLRKKIGITGEGDCHQKGYTEPISIRYSKVEKPMAKWQQYHPACQGMKILNFGKPEKPTPQQINERTNVRLCGDTKKPYRVISTTNPKTCSVFCVPEGPCEQALKRRQVDYEGNCQQEGFTESIEQSDTSTVHWLEEADDRCKGIDMLQFQRPQSKDTTCETSQKPYEALNKNYPDICSVYCVPEGECESNEQMLKNLGITSPGNCKSQGYTAPMELSALTNSTVGLLLTQPGPCKGMTVKKFQRPVSVPALIHEKAASGQTLVDNVCGNEMVPYEARYMGFPDSCGVFCVPRGECEDDLQRGKLNHLGIREQGDCTSKGFTEIAKFGALSQSILNSIKDMTGSCKEMTYSKFQRPEFPAPEN